MSDFFFTLLVVLLAAAVLLREDFVFTLLYLWAGALILARWWGTHSLASLSLRRSFTPRLFLGETAQVTLEVTNRGWLPLPWLQVRESLPTELSGQGEFQQVTSLGPRGRLQLLYTVEARKRGYYPLGPAFLSSGDVLGLGGTKQWSVSADHLTVFPKIIPLESLRLPSRSPLETLRHTQPLFEDPARVRGKRDYCSGDSLRRVDWKASASAGRLQVKQFEPSIALETVIVLNLRGEDFEARLRLDMAELAIVAAASLASWISGRKQAVGLATNGRDVLQPEKPAEPLPPRRGRGHLLRLLETLARMQITAQPALPELFHQVLPHFSWGTTLIVVSGRLDDDVLEALFEARRSGLQAVLVQIGLAQNIGTVRQRGAAFGFPLVQILEERDLVRWSVLAADRPRGGWAYARPR